MSAQHTISTSKIDEHGTGDERVRGLVSALHLAGTGTSETRREYKACKGNRVVETQITFVSGPIADRLEELETERISTVRLETLKARRGPWGIFVRETTTNTGVEVKTIVYYTATSKQVSVIRAGLKAALSTAAQESDPGATP